MNVSKTAIVTGATGGLGQAVVKKLTENGWQLVLTGRDGEKLKALYGYQHIQLVADCSTIEGVSQIFDAVKSIGLKPTCLVHCVGNIKIGALHRMSETDFLECMSANLFSTFYTLSGFVKQLKELGIGGSAVFVSSAAAQIGTPNHEAVAAAKGGLEALVRSAAATYASANIRVNAVAPGILDTPAADKILGSELGRQMAAKQYPIYGIGMPEQVADLILWLLSESAGRVTGQTWGIDGGFSSVRPLVK